MKVMDLTAFALCSENNMPIIVFNMNVEGVEIEDDLRKKYAVYKNDLIDKDHPWRHDPEKVTRVIMDLYRERTGPLTME